MIQCPSSVGLHDMVIYNNDINKIKNSDESSFKTFISDFYKQFLVGQIFAVKNYELNNIPYTVTPIGTTTKVTTCNGPIDINKADLIEIKKQLNEMAKISNLGYVSGFNSDNNPIPFPEVEPKPEAEPVTTSEPIKYLLKQF